MCLEIKHRGTKAEITSSCKSENGRGRGFQVEVEKDSSLFWRLDVGPKTFSKEISKQKKSWRQIQNRENPLKLKPKENNLYSVFNDR